MATNLSGMTFDPELREGAANAINVCLAVQPGESLLIVTDQATLEIAAALYAAAEAAGAKPESLVLEDLAPRPQPVMPQPVLDALERVDVALFAAQPQEGEVRARREILRVVERRLIRYGHMVWISKQIMCEGMRADYHRVDELAKKVLALAAPAREIRVISAGGTDMVATFDPNRVWVKTSGIINPRYWGNLPGGEVFTAPEVVNGVFVADGAVGDYLCPIYGNLGEYPLRMEIVNSRLVSCSSPNKNLERDFWDYCHMDPENGDRLGEFAFGVNLAVKRLIGNLLQDEKFPGVHIAFGDPYASQTMAPWSSNSHIDAITTRCSAWIDGVRILRDGAYTLE